MSGPSPIVKVRLKGPVHARFLAEQQARGISESELLRLALQQFFESVAPPPMQPQQLEGNQKIMLPSSFQEATLARKTVWMPAFLMNAVSERATQKGMSFSRWMSALVQSNLMEQPVLTEIELLALEASTRELATIGRYIHQVVRALDEAYFETERIRLDKLSELSKTITQTRVAIDALVRASRSSWRTDECHSSKQKMR